jgi:hypothetical protein
MVIVQTTPGGGWRCSTKFRTAQDQPTTKSTITQQEGRMHGQPDDTQQKPAGLQHVNGLPTPSHDLSRSVAACRTRTEAQNPTSKSASDPAAAMTSRALQLHTPLLITCGLHRTGW